MKKLILALAILGAASAFNSYADTTNTTTTTTTTTNSQQPTKQHTKADKSQNTNNSGNDSGSVYESIRSGWNSFIDVLTGTTSSSK